MKTVRRPMYNEEQKNAFIQEAVVSESTRKSAVNVMTAIAPFEEKAGRDIALWESEDLLSVLESVCGLRTRSKYSKLAIITNYRKWCAAKGFEGAKGDTPDLSDLNTDKIKTMLVRSPAHLQQCLDIVFDPESDETQDNVYRCFFWLAYGGMDEATIHKLTSKDVNFEYMEAKYGSEVAILYRHSLQAVRNCVRLKSFLYRNESYTNKKEIRRDRVPGEELLRGVRGTPSMMNFRMQLSRKLAEKRTDKEQTAPLTYTRVWLSGVFYRIYEAEQAGIAPDFHAIAMDSPGGKKVLAGESKADPKTALQAIAKDFRTDYNRWKLVVSTI